MLRAPQAAAEGWARSCRLVSSSALLRPSRLSWSNFPTALGGLWPNFQGSRAEFCLLNPRPRPAQRG